MSQRIALFASTAVVLLGAAGASAATLTSNGTPTGTPIRATAYGLGDQGETLVTLGSGTGASGSVDLVFDGDPTKDISLDGLDYRPETGEVFGYDDATDTIYSIDLVTGFATTVATQAGLTQDNDLDLDFNPTIDAVRIVTGDTENVVYNPNTNAFTTAVDLFYPLGDPNDPATPNAVFNAYNNNVDGATTTQQFVIDTKLNTVATLANNAGTLGTIGQLTLNGSPFDVTENGGFDVLSFATATGFDNTYLALLTDADTGAQGIYSLAITPGSTGPVSLTFVGMVTTDFGTIDGFTLVPSQVPVPAAGFLLIGGLGAMVAVRRRRRSA